MEDNQQSSNSEIKETNQSTEAMAQAPVQASVQAPVQASVQASVQAPEQLAAEGTQQPAPEAIAEMAPETPPETAPVVSQTVATEAVPTEQASEANAAPVADGIQEEAALEPAVEAEEPEPKEEIPPPLPDNKILENKRKIITRIKAKDLNSSNSLFFETFSSYYPADIEFLNTIYTELTRNNNYDAFYKLLKKITSWYEGNEEYDELSETATKLYIDNLVLQGNNNIFERNERLEITRKNSRRSDSEMSKSYETDKILQSLSSKAIECFEKALELDPENLPALNGAKNCYEFIDDYENFERVMRTIERVLMHKSGIVEKLEQDDAKLKEQEEREQSEQVFEQFQTEFTHITNLFIDEKNEEFLEFFEKIHNPATPYIPLILLKARVLARMRRFKESDRFIEIAEKSNSHFPELNEAKTEIRKVKHALYKKAADYYLERALLKGVTFGKADFVKAKEALEKAMHFVTDDINMLDQYHTVLKYLKQEREAFKTKGIIYSIDPEYTTSFEQELSNRMCFIASYAFVGQPQHVDVFRWYRREFLLNSDFGRRLNCLYVTLSPRVVRALAPYPVGVYLCRAILFLPLLMIKLLQKCIKR